MTTPKPPTHFWLIDIDDGNRQSVSVKPFSKSIPVITVEHHEMLVKGLVEALKDTVDFGYDQAGHCEQALAKYEASLKGEK